jgi:hypothetical protein
MTQSEFIKKYLSSPAMKGITEERWNELGQFAVLCECGQDGCKGWAMISKDNMQAQIDLYLKK